MSWQQKFVRCLRAASSASSKRGGGYVAREASCCMQRALQPSSNSIAAATCSRPSAALPSASLASARAFSQSSRGLPFAAASLLQQSRRSSQPSFPPSATTQAVGTCSSNSAAAGTGGEGAAGSTGLMGDGEDDEETLEKEPRTKPRPKEPPDPAPASTEGTMQEKESIQGSSAADGEHIFFLSRSQRVQRSLSREAAAHLHHVVQVRESKLGALPRLRVGKEGLKKAFLASVADYLQVHGVVKVQVPKNSGLEPGFVAFCLEASQDCIILGQKGNTLTAYRDTSLPRPPSTYADSDTTFLEHRQQLRPYQQHSAYPHGVVRSHGAHEQHVLQQLANQQQPQGQPWTAAVSTSVEAAKSDEYSDPLPALRRLDGDDELEEEQAGMGLRQLDCDNDLERDEVGIQAGALGGAQGMERHKQKEPQNIGKAAAASTAEVDHMRAKGVRRPRDVAGLNVVGSGPEERGPDSNRSRGKPHRWGLPPKAQKLNLGKVVSY